MRRPAARADGYPRSVSAPIVHLVTRLNVGGIARYLDQVVPCVDRLWRGRVQGPEQEATWRGLQAFVPGLGRALRMQDDVRAWRTLERWLGDRRPRVLHTHASKAGTLGRIAARRLGIPVVHTFHGHVLSNYFPRPVGALFQRVERWLGSRAVLTATGPATANALASLLGHRVRVLPPALSWRAPDVVAAAAHRASWGGPVRVALAVGRAAAVKDHPRFVAAARAAGFLPVIAGATRITGALCLGTVPMAAMPEIYAAADVVVSSSAQEGTPYALLEAAWCQRPVVATPVGDVSWVVGTGGIVTDDLAAGLKKLRDPALRAAMGARAGVLVRQRFTPEAAQAALRTLYDEVAPG